MINYIKEETDNKCDKIKKDAESEAQLGKGCTKIRADADGEP